MYTVFRLCALSLFEKLYVILVIFILLYKVSIYMTYFFQDGLTALNIAQKLGYISVMEVLKGLSYDTLAPDNKNWDEKYKVIAPESLQETSFMSDSDDEGGMILLCNQTLNMLI